MSKSLPDAYQNQVFQRILPFIDADNIDWVHANLKQKNFNKEYMGKLELIESYYQENQKKFEKNIEQGILSKLPPSNPYAASKFGFEEKIHFPLDDVNLGLVFDESDHFKGYQITVDGLPLQTWCDQNGLDANDYLLILQLYFEDALQNIGMIYENGRFVELSLPHQSISSKKLFSALQNQQQQDEIALALSRNGLMNKNKKLQIHLDAISKVTPSTTTIEKTNSGPTAAG